MFFDKIQEYKSFQNFIVYTGSISLGLFFSAHYLLRTRNNRFFNKVFGLNYKLNEKQTFGLKRKQLYLGNVPINSRLVQTHVSLQEYQNLARGYPFIDGIRALLYATSINGFGFLVLITSLAYFFDTYTFKQFKDKLDIKFNKGNELILLPNEIELEKKVQNIKTIKDAVKILYEYQEKQ